MSGLNEVHKLLIQRRSIYAFSPTPVKEDDLLLLFDAARKAPSSSNIQPWRFIYATSSFPEEYQRLFDLLDKGNKVWAGSAPVLILSLTEAKSPNDGEPNYYAFHDLGMATANLMLQASYLGLSTHPMGGYDKDKARIVLNIPDNVEPAAMIAVGYQGINDNLPLYLKKRIAEAGTRKEIDTFVFRAEYRM